MAHVPNPTDVVGTIDTTGINPGPHSTLDGVSPIFAIAKDDNDKSIEEHFAEKAFAAGTEAYQADNPVGPEPHESNPFPPANETSDTSDTGGRAPGDTINQDLAVMTSSDQTGADHTSGTVTGPDGTAVDGGIDDPKASVADPKADGADGSDGSGDVGTGPLDKRKVTQLRTLAARENVDLGSADTKAEIVTVLRDAGVTDEA